MSRSRRQPVSKGVDVICRICAWLQLKHGAQKKATTATVSLPSAHDNGTPGSSQGSTSQHAARPTTSCEAREATASPAAAATPEPEQPDPVAMAPSWQAPAPLIPCGPKTRLEDSHHCNGELAAIARQQELRWQSWYNQAHPHKLDLHHHKAPKPCMGDRGSTWVPVGAPLALHVALTCKKKQMKEFQIYQQKEYQWKALPISLI